MRVNQYCAECLYDKQQNLTDDKEYLSEIKQIIDNRGEDDTAPYLVYLFSKAYEKKFGQRHSYSEIKKKYNDYVLSMESTIRNNIEASADPLAVSLLYARAGNYIDFGAMNSVDEKTFLSLLEDTSFNDRDRDTYASFIEDCRKGTSFLLISDNCGEIVLDKLFLEQLKKRFPDLEISVMVRGGEILNDATEQDAHYTGIDKLAKIVSNGMPVAGTVYNLLADEAKNVLDNAGVILAKGQGNYESLCRQGRHIYYSFLCKCDLFTGRFNVPKLTGLFIRETGETGDGSLSPSPGSIVS